MDGKSKPTRKLIETTFIFSYRVNNLNFILRFLFRKKKKNNEMSFIISIYQFGMVFNRQLWNLQFLKKKNHNFLFLMVLRYRRGILKVLDRKIVTDNHFWSRGKTREKNSLPSLGLLSLSALPFFALVWARRLRAGQAKKIIRPVLIILSLVKRKPVVYWCVRLTKECWWLS